MQISKLAPLSRCFLTNEVGSGPPPKRKKKLAQMDTIWRRPLIHASLHHEYGYSTRPCCPETALKSTVPLGSRGTAYRSVLLMVI